MALDVQTQMRLTGMASGLDTDAVIQNLGKVHNLRINKVKQDKQILQWRQDSYRETIGKLTSFMKSNLNTANPATNFRSSAAFAKFSYSLKGTMTVGGREYKAEDLMSVTANGDLKKFSQLVQGVAQLATKDTWTGAKMDLQGIRTSGFNLSNFGVIDLGNGSVAMGAKYAVFGISIDGTSRTVSISPDKILDAYYAGMGHEVKFGADESRELTGSDKTSFVDHFVHGATDVLGKNAYVRDDAEPDGYKKIDGDFLDDIIQAAGLGTALDDTIPEHMQAIRDYFKDVKIYGEPGDAGSKDEVVAGFINEEFDDSNGDPYYVFDNGTYRVVDASLLDSIVSGTYDKDDINHRYAVEDYFNTHAIFQENPAHGDATEEFAKLINSEIAGMFGSNFSDVVSVTLDGELRFQKSGSNITLFEQTGFDTLQNMGLGSGASTAGVVTNRKISALAPGLFPPGIKEATVKINDVDIKVTDEDTVSSLMTKINNSEAGVTLAYNSASDRFTFSSKLEGEANKIKSMDAFAVELLGRLGIGVGDSTHSEAKNFVAIINGEEFVRQTNTFTHEGMTYTFNKEFNATIDTVTGKAVAGPEDPLKIEVSKNTNDIVANIKNFIDEYNALVTHLNDLLNGKRDRDYPPLTDDERKAMKDEEIKLYEEKAKSGLMANDTQLRKVLSDMRSAIYQKVEGVNLTMTDIGITTTPNYKDGGLLVINEDKLKAALENNYDGVVALFSKSPATPAFDKSKDDISQKSAIDAKRYSEGGIAQRLNDILISAAGTSTTGDKGYLVQKAGVANDRTQFDNQMTKQLNDYDKKIDQLLERWYRQENAYYAMFARMETAMSKLQAQQNSLAQIMAQGGGGK